MMFLTETSNSSVSSDSYLNSYLRSALHSDITKSLWLGETSEDNLVQLPLKAESAREAGQGFLQLGCEHHQGWRLHSLSRQPVPVCNQPHSKRTFLCVEISDYPVFQFLPIASHPFMRNDWEGYGSIFFIPSHQVCLYIDKIPQSLSFSRQIPLQIFPCSFTSVAMQLQRGHFNTERVFRTWFLLPMGF